MRAWAEADCPPDAGRAVPSEAWKSPTCGLSTTGREARNREGAKFGLEVLRGFSPGCRGTPRWSRERGFGAPFKGDDAGSGHPEENLLTAFSTQFRASSSIRSPFSDASATSRFAFSTTEAVQLRAASADASLGPT